MNSADRESLFRGTLLVVVVVFVGFPCAAQSSTTESSNELWTAINASFELSERSRITAIFEKHNGEEGAFGEEKIGAIFSYRVRLLSQLINDNDKENEYNLILGAGYVFIRTEQAGGHKSEHRLLLQATPKYVFRSRHPGAGSQPD